MSSVVEVDEATEAVVRVTGDAGADNDTKLPTCDLALKTGKHKSRVWGMFTKRKSKPMLGDGELLRGELMRQLPLSTVMLFPLLSSLLVMRDLLCRLYTSPNLQWIRLPGRS